VDQVEIRRLKVGEQRKVADGASGAFRLPFPGRINPALAHGMSLSLGQIASDLPECQNVRACRDDGRSFRVVTLGLSAPPEKG
jgi:hypothetical protein